MALCASSPTVDHALAAGPGHEPASLSRLLVISFLMAIATIFVVRGVYFYTEQHFGFTRGQNLLLALAFGVIYAGGAAVSHHVARLAAERTVLLALILGLSMTSLIPALWPRQAVVVACCLTLPLMNGAMWALVQSYVSAGRAAHSASRAIGLFNITWSGTVPLSVAVVGPLLAIEALAWWPRSMPPLMFALPAAAGFIALWLARRLPVRPAYLPDDHPDRLPAALTQRYAALLLSSRATLFAGCAVIFILVPQVPVIFRDRFDLPVHFASPLAALLDLARWLGYALFMATVFWHGRPSVLIFAMLALPTGLLAALLGQHWTVVAVGELLCGAGVGAAGAAAIYYALQLKNAAVQAGGYHETVIGLGFAVGPLAGLFGLALHDTVGQPLLADAIGVTPVILIGLAAGLWPLRRILLRRAL
jgi:hypothetical protein